MAKRRWGRDRKTAAPPSSVVDEVKAAQTEVQQASEEIDEVRRLIAESPGWVPPVMTAVWEE